MTVLALLLAIAAIVVLLLAAFNVPARLNLLALGVAILAAAWIFELLGPGVHHHFS